MSAGGADVDVVVVGGGINGTGVARDAALRGLKVALLERNDLAFGASGNSSGMIHGGPRYMTSDPAVTRASCLDSGHIQRIAPHLVFRVPFLMPIGPEGAEPTRLDLVDAFFEAYDRYQPLKNGKRHARLTPAEVFQLEPSLFGGPGKASGRLVGAISFDEWGIDGARLCVANAVDAIEHGADVRTHASVEAIAREPADLFTVRGQDLLGGAGFTLTARAVINATGAWTALLARAARLPPARARVRPGKGIHVVLEGRLTRYAVLAKAIDGRQIFIEPWQDVTLIGTTDDDFYGDPDDVRATTDEARYLIEGIARVLPAVAGARAIGTTAGVRPTLYGYGPNEDALSRDHRVVDHAGDGAPGLFSMIGGKLASYRLFAEEATDRVMAYLGGPVVACRTHEAALPGGDRTVSSAALARRIGRDERTAARLAYRHGSRAERIAERILARPEEAAIVCACEPVLEAEVRHVVRAELARTVADVARRTRLGLGACGGMRCAARCGQIVAEEQGLSARHGARLAVRFLIEGAKARAVVVGREQAQQEALALAAARSTFGPWLDEDS